MKIDSLAAAYELAKKYQAAKNAYDYLKIRNKEDDLYSIRVEINNVTGHTFRVPKEEALDLFHEHLEALEQDLSKAGILFEKVEK